MRFSPKYVLVILVFLLTFACIYALNAWHQQRLVKEPLAEALLKIDGVSAVELNLKDRKMAEVYITLNEVGDLPQTYGQIEEVLAATYGRDSFKIILADNRDPYLETVYNQLHFALMEGERCGNYISMSQQIFSQLEQDEHLKKYRLWVDQQRIYLMLVTSQNILYEVVPIGGAAEAG